MRSMRVFCLAVIISLASPLSAASAAPREPALRVENMQVVVNADGFASVHGLVVCDFPTDPSNPDLQEIGAQLVQGSSSSYSIGDFTQCGRDIDISPFPGADDGTRYQAGSAFLTATLTLCSDGSQLGPCYTWSFSGDVTLTAEPVLSAPTLQLTRLKTKPTASGDRLVSATLAWRTDFRGGYPTQLCAYQGGEFGGCVFIDPSKRRYTTPTDLLGPVPPGTVLEYVMTVFPPASHAQNTNTVTVQV